MFLNKLLDPHHLSQETGAELVQVLFLVAASKPVAYEFAHG